MLSENLSFDFPDTTNFMALLNENSSQNESHIQSTSTPTETLKHVTQHHSDHPTSKNNKTTRQSEVYSPTIILSRTIAKFVTKCFSHRKKFSSTTQCTSNELPGTKHP